MKIDPALWIKPDFSFLPDYEKQERDDKWSLKFAFTAFFVSLILLFFTASVAACDELDSLTLEDLIAADNRTAGSFGSADSCWYEPAPCPDPDYYPGGGCLVLHVEKKCKLVPTGYVFEADTIVVEGRPILRVDTIHKPTPGLFYPILPVYPRYDTVYVDTTLFYAKVDTLRWCFEYCGDTTCCEKGWSIIQIGEAKCIGDSWYDLDTTWLPKVQVYLDSCKYRELMELLIRR